MPDEADPPRKHYGFKDREFKRDNAPISAETAMPTAKELAMMAGPVTNQAKAYAGAKKADDPNDVYAALEKNRAVEQKHGLNEVEIKEIKSRRKRDWLILVIGGNLAIAAMVALSGFNIVTVAFGFSGMIVLTLGATWVMWQIMSKY